MPLARSRKTQVGLKLNGTHQLLLYAEVVNLQGDNLGPDFNANAYFFLATKKLIWIYV
jgi:hypothetical protein